MATFRKRGDKWHVQVRRRGSGNFTKTFTLKADAIEWGRETERALERTGLPPHPRVLRRFTVADILTRYRDEVVPRRKCVRNEVTALNAFLRTPIASVKLSEIRGAHFAAYRDERLKIIRPASLNREFSLLQTIFEVARKDWGIPLSVNPLAGVRKPKPDKPRDRRLKDGEWDKILKACGDCHNGSIKPIVSFALETAMRRSEILKAKWPDVNWADHTLHIPITKNGHSRTIPLTVAALSVLASMGYSPVTLMEASIRWEPGAKAEPTNILLEAARGPVFTNLIVLGRLTSHPQS